MPHIVIENCYQVMMFVFLAVCDECDREWEGDCPVHGPLEVIPDTKVSVP